LNILRSGLKALTRFAEKMRGYTLKEKAKITAGAVAALVIVAWLAIIALALLSGDKSTRLAVITELCSTPARTSGTLFSPGELRTRRDANP
jgi:hypothetical protein